MRLIYLVILVGIVFSLLSCGEGEVVAREVEGIFVMDAVEEATLAATRALQKELKFYEKESAQSLLIQAANNSHMQSEIYRHSRPDPNKGGDENTDYIYVAHPVTVDHFDDDDNPYRLKVRESSPETMKYRIIRTIESREVEDIMNKYILMDPKTGEIRSVNWEVFLYKTEIKIIEIIPTNPARTGKDKRAFNKLFKSLKDDVDFSACINIDSAGHVSISLTGKKEGEFHSYQIKFDSEAEFDTEAEIEHSFFGGKPKKFDFKLGHKLSLNGKPEIPDDKFTFAGSLCYPFKESEMSVTKNGETLKLTPEDISFEF